jgi:hypothetical protein
LANHLTPTELAREAGLDRSEVLSKCREMGVPIFHGCIDRSLFLANLREQELGEQSEVVTPAAITGASQSALRSHAA